MWPFSKGEQLIKPKQSSEVLARQMHGIEDRIAALEGMLEREQEKLIDVRVNLALALHFEDMESDDGA